MWPLEVLCQRKNVFAWIFTNVLGCCQNRSENKINRANFRQFCKSRHDIMVSEGIGRAYGNFFGICLGIFACWGLNVSNVLLHDGLKQKLPGAGDMEIEGLILLSVFYMVMSTGQRTGHLKPFFFFCGIYVTGSLSRLDQIWIYTSFAGLPAFSFFAFLFKFIL